MRESVIAPRRVKSVTSERNHLYMRKLTKNVGISMSSIVSILINEAIETRLARGETLDNVVLNEKDIEEEIE